VTPTIPAVAAVLEAGLAEGIAEALSAHVLLGGKTLHASLHGTLEDGGRQRPLGRDDLFDLASLTKVLATTGLAAQLVAEGALELDVPVARYLSGFAADGKGQVTVRQLLAHSSGLPGYRPYHEAVARDAVARVAFLPKGERPPAGALVAAFARGKALVAEAALAERLEAAPGSRAVYSDVGFIALGVLLEQVGKASLSTLAEERLFRPLGLGSTFFLDGQDPVGTSARAAGRAFLPTGNCPHRREVNRGAVNDDNAWAMGGVAGHAGLFSLAADVAAVGQAWLEALEGGKSVVPAAVAEEFARRDATPGSDRALGWDTPGEGSSIGEKLGRGSRGAIGHLGYTGTSLWIDVDAGLVCVLLTNHTHPSGLSQKPRIRELRRRFHDAIAAG
jgi:CubicO group peptidase (beta-lactamase class C family)